MNARLQVYQNFIDAIAKIRTGVLPQWIKNNGWPDIPENNEINSFLNKLTSEEKEVLISIVNQARDGGIHDTLAHLSEEINLSNLKLSKQDIELATEPYGTPLHWDWISRSEGDSWPNDQLEDEYK